MTESSQSKRRLIVLGSTGSIGVNTLKVVEHLNHQAATSIEVVGLAAGQNADLLVEQARRFKVGAVAISDKQRYQTVRDALPCVTVLGGPDASLRLVEQVDATDLCSAIVGIAGLPATMAAIEKGMSIALANKETLVAAGAFVCPKVQQHQARLIPVDSEHSAIFQCLAGQSRDDVERIVLTASGGPFRTVDRAVMAEGTVEKALNHPTWDMGAKITIDSATMMNKALEIVEAHWLFDLPPAKISVIVHPQSIVHSFVEFRDGSVLAQLGPPDMKTPIQYALTYPDRPKGCSQTVDWSKLQTLDFEEPDFEKFGALRMAYDVIEVGGTAGAVFNASNEAAVAAFLEGRIRFGCIVELVAEAIAAIDQRPLTDLAGVLEADRNARSFVNDRIAQLHERHVTAP